MLVGEWGNLEGEVINDVIENLMMRCNNPSRILVV
jgi:hypothetical protein